jgi:hypothetical protein
MVGTKPTGSGSLSLSCFISFIVSTTFIENLIYLTPFIPLSFEGEGEMDIEGA